MMASNDYNPVRDWKNDYKNKEDCVENDLEFKKSFNNKKTTSDRYNENNNQPFSKSIVFNNSNGFQPKNTYNNIEEILKSLDKSSKSKVALIQSFLKVEKTYIEKEINDLYNDKVF